jgi:hypothetical protein
MKHVWRGMVAGIALLGAGAGCERTGNTLVDADTGRNYLVNTSFERGGAPTIVGWQEHQPDTGYVSFAADAPPGGGEFAVRLRNEWTFPGSIRQTLTGIEGRNVYRVGASAKVVPTGLFAGGDLSLQVQRSGVWVTTQSVHFTDTTWTDGSLVDTLTTGMTDSIAVVLSGDFGQFSSGYVLFDLVSLEVLK